MIKVSRKTGKVVEDNENKALFLEFRARMDYVPPEKKDEEDEDGDEE